MSAPNLLVVECLATELAAVGTGFQSTRAGQSRRFNAWKEDMVSPDGRKWDYRGYAHGVPHAHPLNSTMGYGRDLSRCNPLGYVACASQRWRAACPSLRNPALATSATQLALDDRGARVLANATKPTAQLSTITTPRWFSRLLPWVPVESGIYRVNKVKDASRVTVDCSRRDEQDVPDTFVGYEERPREYLLSSIADVRRQRLVSRSTVYGRGEIVARAHCHRVTWRLARHVRRPGDW